MTRETIPATMDGKEESQSKTGDAAKPPLDDATVVFTVRHALAERNDEIINANAIIAKLDKTVAAKDAEIAELRAKAEGSDDAGQMKVDDGIAQKAAYLTKAELRRIDDARGWRAFDEADIKPFVLTAMREASAAKDAQIERLKGANEDLEITKYRLITMRFKQALGTEGEGDEEKNDG